MLALMRALGHERFAVTRTCAPRCTIRPSSTACARTTAPGSWSTRPTTPRTRRSGGASPAAARPWSEHDDVEELWGDPRIIWRTWTHHPGTCAGSASPRATTWPRRRRRPWPRRCAPSWPPERTAAACGAAILGGRGSALRRRQRRDPDGPARAPGGRDGSRPARARVRGAARRADAPADARRGRRPGAPARRGHARCAPRSSRAGRTRWSSTGPPGTGKTTLARIVADAADAAFEELSAVEAGRAEVRAVIERAAHRRRRTRRAHVLFLDEIHRFNKAQQDVAAAGGRGGPRHADRRDDGEPLLRGQRGAALAHAGLRAARADAPHDVERPAAPRDRRAARRPDRDGRRRGDRRSSRRARGGDARTALQALELAAATAPRRRAGHARASPRTRCSAARVRYDKRGDQHYDTISAWIKATRGSDPDASLYYLAVMLEGGEDPRFIARRMVILASEDIGNADPQALCRRRRRGRAPSSTSGMPEASHALAQAAIYLVARAEVQGGLPRDRAARAATCATRGAQTPPPYLRCAVLPGRGRARPRPRLRRPARAAGPPQRPGAPARRARRRALLPSPTTPRPRCASASRRSAAPAGARHKRGGDPPSPRAHGDDRAMPSARTRASADRVAQPRRRRLLGSVPRATRREVGAAVDRAAEVQRLWAMLRLQDRARYMARAAQAVIDEFDELARPDLARAGPPARRGRGDGAAARRSRRCSGSPSAARASSRASGSASRARSIRSSAGAGPTSRSASSACSARRPSRSRRRSATSPSR